MKTGPYYIYAWVDPDGQILYVGHTSNPWNRNKTHRSGSPWWTPSLEWAVISVHDDRAAALFAEGTAIRDLTPPHNVNSTGGPASAETGRALRKMRRAHGATLRDIAERVGVSTSLLCRIESGERSASAALVQRIYDALPAKESVA